MKSCEVFSALKELKIHLGAQGLSPHQILEKILIIQTKWSLCPKRY